MVEFAKNSVTSTINHTKYVLQRNVDGI